MRYSYEYKRKCIDMYRQGSWPDKPESIKDEENFHKMIRGWCRIEESCGLEALKHKSSNKVWTLEEKYELVAKILAGQPIKDTAYKAGIDPGMLRQWVQKYKTKGYNGLVNIKKGRPSKVPEMKKESTPLTESEREELIRLRAEIEYIKAENEVIKKEIALRQEKWAAQLKAKKQQSSKNFAKKDIN
jgi:transposase-like protein